MSDIDSQVLRLRRSVRLLSWVVALGAAFDLWEFVRLAAAIRVTWGQP